MSMPKFSNPGGVFPSLPLVPPFYFENMTVRMFPLRARLSTLQGFVDRYLNIVPGEVGRFRVAVPYVYLMLIDYGKLAAQTGNVGYVAQREVMFLVPTQWYRVTPDGRWEFVDWAIATPFIFVDDFLAMVIGRQMYGWPKLLCRLSPVMDDWLGSDPRAPTLTPSRWMHDPRSGLTAATISTPVFSDVYAGGEQQWRVLLEVDRAPPVTPFELPMNLTSAYTPWVAMGNAAAAMTGFARDFMGMLSGMGIVPLQPGADPSSYARMAQQTAWMANPFQARTPPPYPNTGGGPSTNLYGNTINLQQFRDSRYPSRYCYQALTSAAMSVVSFNAGGMLGDMSTLWGDQSGGYRIRMYDWPSLPIVDMLGLERAAHFRGTGCRCRSSSRCCPSGTRST